MQYAHPELDVAKRRGYLAIASRLPKPLKRPKLDKGQLTLPEAIHKEAAASYVEQEEPMSDDDAACSQVETVGSRNFPRYNIHEHMSFVSLTSFLRSVDGKGKSEKVATEMSTDVSKYLKFACGSAIAPDFERLMDRDMVLAFLDKLERCGIGVEGRINKLDALDAALSFLQLCVLKDQPTHIWHQRAMRMKDSLKAWKATMRKEKTKKRAQRLEELSSQQVSIAEVTGILECKPMWTDFHECLRKSETGRTVSSKELKECTAAIAALLLFKSWQRPGAAANLTVHEYQERRTVLQGEEEVVVIRCKEHKTGMSGSAKLTLNSADLSKVEAYVTHIRPLTCPGDSPNLLLLPGGKPISHMQNVLKSLQHKYKVVVPTPTLVRKAGATATARHISGETGVLIRQQLSHSSETDLRFYQAIRGDAHAATAFQTMEKLRSESVPSVAGNANLPQSSAVTSHTSQEAGPTTTTKRRKFTTAEEQKVASYFATAIRHKKTVSAADCRLFLQANPMDRTPKQIQDKVRNWMC